MLLALATAVVLSQAPAETRLWDPSSEPGTLRPWMPYQGHLAFNGMLAGPQRTLGVDAYFGKVAGKGEYGPSGHGGGWFVGYGGHGTFGATQSFACRRGEFCVGRWIVGPALRAGRAWAYRRENEDEPWPDGYTYVEVFPFLGRTVLESAPLVPGSAYLEAGARFALAANLVGWTRLATSGMDDAFRGSTGGNELAAVLLWLAIAFTNHFEVNLELSRGIAGPMARAGFSVGSGF